MKDYYTDFLMSVLVWIVWGLFYEFGFRRSKDEFVRSLSKYNLLAWLGITEWMIYSLIMWRRAL